MLHCAKLSEWSTGDVVFNDVSIKQQINTSWSIRMQSVFTSPPSDGAWISITEFRQSCRA